MIIDAHTHIFPEEITGNREKYTSDTNFSLLYSNSDSKMACVTDIMEYLTRDAIDAAIAMSFPWYSEKVTELHNEYMASCQQQYKDKIYSFGMVPRDIPLQSISTFVASIKTRGISGIGEIAFYHSGFNTSAADYLSAVLDACSQHSLPVCLHINEEVGHMYPGKYPPRLDILYSIISQFPEVKLLLSHWGGGLPFFELMPEVKDVLKNCVYDTAASPYIYDNQIYSSTRNIIGPERILFGTDFPLLHSKKYFSAIDNEIHDKKEKKLICGGNAKKFLELGDQLES